MLIHTLLDTQKIPSLSATSIDTYEIHIMRATCSEQGFGTLGWHSAWARVRSEGLFDAEATSAHPQQRACAIVVVGRRSVELHLDDHKTAAVRTANHAGNLKKPMGKS